MGKKKMTMGLIVGNRGFFPDHLAKSGREEMLRVLGKAGIEVVALTPEQSKYGAVETREESRRCADLFRQNRESPPASRPPSARAWLSRAKSPGPSRCTSTARSKARSTFPATA